MISLTWVDWLCNQAANEIFVVLEIASASVSGHRQWKGFALSPPVQI